MLERKLYKTKICVLYRRGHCARESCSFAHGDAELRRFSGSFNGRRDYRGNALGVKLIGRHSPQRRYSPGRDARGRHGYSPSRSPEKRSERKHRKRQHLDGHSDFSRDLKISDGFEDRVKEKKLTSYDSGDVLEDQLKQVQLDIDMFDDHKGQLEINLEERIQEADSLKSRIEELETQLNKEQEDCKRITSKIKKFTKAHNHYSRVQEELKRSQARLQRLGNQLGSDASKPGANKEDSSVNIISDGEPNGNNGMSPQSELQNHASPSRKRPRINLGATEEAKPANSRKREGILVGAARSEKQTRWDGPPAQSNNNSKEVEAVNKILIESNGLRTLSKEYKHKRGKNGSHSILSVDKLKGLESGPVLPSTSMAAHAIDELIEVIEMEKIELVEGASRAVEKGNTYESTGLPYLPPPPPSAPQNAYSKYECDDEDVDVEQLDQEMGGVDFNSEVDIEKL